MIKITALTDQSGYKIIDLKSMNIWTAIIVSFIAVELIPRASSHLANLVGPALIPLDPDGVFAWISVHHLFQLALTILVMLIVFRGALSDWGFNFNKWRTSLVIIVVFAIGFGLMEYTYMSGRPYTTDFPQTQINEIGWQGFQYFLSGLGEEPLFRGLVIILLLSGLRSSKLTITKQNIIVVMLSTVLFMYAHLQFDWLSLSAPGYDFSQQTKALQLGVLYAVVFLHTRSLLAPIALHGLSNGISATIGFYII